MLDSTLVLMTTEFGRTPKINGTAGRDHYPKVFSIVMAGGGIKKGCVYGSTDPTGSEPDNDPLNVTDYAATIYHLLGIDYQKNTFLYEGRNESLVGVNPARVLKEILS